ncbi:hypothetical protein HN011_003521 [Eciton burchellii]|nr:hypothetical protein HN011_003521 [Eciton burchellii]
MRVFCVLCGLFLAIALVNGGPVVKRETKEDLNPLNEVYVLELDDGEAADGEKGREKRKIGITLGITNGIVSFVFGKLDTFLDAKTRALTVLDESNRAKNAAFGIDNNQSATSQFLSNLLSQKIQGATNSIGPLINSATAFASTASAGLQNTLASKLAPLSSLSGGLSGGASSGGGSSGGAGTGGTAGGASGSAILGSVLSQKINILSGLSQSSGGLSGGSNSGDTSASSGTNAGVNLGAFANLGGKTTTTTEDTPVFNRDKVSLDIPSNTFSVGFTLITNISKVLNSVILNSARRTQTFLEIFKPFFRGAFAIKGLPSDKLN